LDIKTVIANRRTHKVLGDPQNPLSGSKISRDTVDQLLFEAGNAPFHYACDRIHLNEMPSPVPWRAYKLDKAQCTGLMQQMLTEGDVTKIPNMLAVAEFLIQITWLPDSDTVLNQAAGKDEPVFSGTLRNMEHIAAASAFVQSFLLLASAHGFRTYWSSGGPLRSVDTFAKMNIPMGELLLGSVFLFPEDIKDAEVKQGGMAEKRGSLDDWSRWL